MENDIDILQLNNNIINTYNTYYININIYEQKLESLKSLKNVPENTKNKIQQEITNLEIFIDDILKKKTLSYYYMESSQLIDEYKIQINKPVTIDFMSSKQDTPKINSNIIKDYMNIYNKYSKKIIYNNTHDKCLLCSSKSFINIENIITCKNCGHTINILVQNSSFKDSERINIIPKYTYNRKSHFRDCINQFQGKQQSNIKSTVYDDIIKQMELNHLLIGDENTPNKERFKKITKKHIHLFLKETRNSKHYEDINLIYHTLTGVHTNDISHIENKLIDDFEKLTQTYDMLYKDNIERKSFINSQYVLYQLLKKHKYPCDIQNFNILKTNDRQTFHDDICKELFKHLGWNFKCLF